MTLSGHCLSPELRAQTQHVLNGRHDAGRLVKLGYIQMDLVRLIPFLEAHMEKTHGFGRTDVHATVHLIGSNMNDLADPCRPRLVSVELRPHGPAQDVVDLKSTV